MSNSPRSDAQGRPPKLTAVENEAQILYFQRETLTPDVRLARVRLRKGESSLVHKHTVTKDTFFVMSGTLTLTVYLQDGQPEQAYHAICREPVEVRANENGKIVHRIKVHAGEVLVIEPTVTHCAANLDESPCEFLCIEGVGAYDFVQVAES